MHVNRHSRERWTGSQNILSNNRRTSKRMAHKFVSRRRFIEKSVTAGLAVGLGLKIEPLHGSAASGSPEARGLTLKVSGDLTSGYGAVLLFNGRPILRHNQGGEFSAVFQNEEHSVEDRVNDWKAFSWTGDATHVTLEGECKLKNLNATVFVHVDNPPFTFPEPRRFASGDGRIVAEVRGLADATDQLRRLSGPFLNWTGKAVPCRNIFQPPDSA